MYRRDYFLKLVQQFSRMMAKLMGLKESGEIEKAYEMVDEAYQEFFGLTRKIIMETDVQILIAQLKENKLSYEQFDLLARLLYEDASLHKENTERLLSKSLNILNHLNSEQKLYSFEREELIKNINKQLGEV